jgi:hypothetical protein
MRKITIVLLISIITCLCVSCGAQRDGCYGTKGMSGYGH